MPSKNSHVPRKSASKKVLPMPYEDDESEVDEFETERRQRGMYDDSDENSDDQEFGDGSDEEEGSEAESSAMARRRFAGWEQDELDGQEEEFTEESGDDDEDDDEDDSEDDEEDDVPERKHSAKSDQERLASLRKGQ